MSETLIAGSGPAKLLAGTLRCWMRSYASCCDSRRKESTLGFSSRTFSIADFCASVTGPTHDGVASVVPLHRKTVIWSSLPHWSAVFSASWLSRMPTPTRVSETSRVSTTARCIDRLRRRPWRSSVKT